MYTDQIATYQIGRHQFTVSVAADDSSERPWDNDCIYDGVVSQGPHNWTRRDKEPHQRVLYEGRGCHPWLFDVKQYIKVAVSQGCTRKQAAEQLERSFERLRLWASDQWCYVGVTVTRVGAEGEELEQDSLWGIESDDAEYIASTAHEMAASMARAADKARNKARYAARKESQERRYWAARDVVTL